MDGNTDFFHFIWGNTQHRITLILAVVLSTAFMLVFKSCYPYPNLAFDSYHYIYAAMLNLDVDTWPIGYSKFLQLVGFFSHSHILLIWAQYFLEVAASLWFYFTILYLFKLGLLLRGLLFIFLFLNPLFIYSSNFVMSDNLFMTLSLCWITLLIWIICRTKRYMIWVHAFLLGITFCVRYNAMYYPLIAGIAFLLSSFSLRLKIAAIVLQMIPIILFVLFTSYRVEQTTGVRSFSPFAGWKMANNALYMYSHIYQDCKDPLPSRFVPFDTMVRRYFRSRQKQEDLMDYHSSGSDYMFNYQSPLNSNMDLYYGVKDRIVVYMTGAAHFTSFYSAYGSYLVKKHPVDFVRYFIWPNSIRHSIPPLEVFELHSMFILLEGNGLDKIATSWFADLKTIQTEPYYILLRDKILTPFMTFKFFVQIVFAMLLVGFSMLRGFKKTEKAVSRLILLITCFWLCELVFTISTGAIVMRYLLFPFIIEFSFSLILLHYIYYQMDTPRR